MATKLYTRLLHSVLLLHLPYCLRRRHLHLRWARSLHRLLLDRDLTLLSIQSKLELLDAYLLAQDQPSRRVVQPKFLALCALALFFV